MSVFHMIKRTCNHYFYTGIKNSLVQCFIEVFYPDYCSYRATPPKGPEFLCNPLITFMSYYILLFSPKFSVRFHIRSFGYEIQQNSIW